MCQRSFSLNFLRVTVLDVRVSSFAALYFCLQLAQSLIDGRQCPVTVFPEKIFLGSAPDGLDIAIGFRFDGDLDGMLIHSVFGDMGARKVLQHSRLSGIELLFAPVSVPAVGDHEGDVTHFACFPCGAGRLLRRREKGADSVFGPVRD